MLKKSIDGASLIEVLVSLLLMSFMVLSLDAVQLTALHDNRALYFYSVAVNQINNMTQRLSVTHDVNAAVNAWNAENKLVLPHGEGEVAGLFPDYNLKLCWGKQCLQTKIHITALP